MRRNSKPSPRRDASTLQEPSSMYPMKTDYSGPGPSLLTVSTASENAVVNQDAETLGTVHDILVDVAQGRVAYAVMTSGGFMGVAERLFALPWKALTLDVQRRCFMLDADRSIFDNAPTFDKNHWPEAPDRRWHEQIHEHYATAPYWQ